MAKRKRRSKMLHGMGGGLFMIGLGVMFLLNIPFWPWILALIGITSVPSSIAEDGLWAGLQTLVWMGGLAIIFATGQWALILILIGLSTMLGAMVRPELLKGKNDMHKTGPQVNVTLGDAVDDEDILAAEDRLYRDRAAQ
ncbi:MAG: hypothetical protein K8S97_13435 [Anaerolineae bacterium]|nr:hypothetical protein [Anaerolineae bacterium]